MNINKQTAVKSTQSAVGLLDSIDFAAIFSMFFRGFLHTFLEEIGKYIFFPIAAGAAIIQALLLWYQTYLEGGNKRTMARAIMETLAAVAVSVAVIGALVFTSTFLLATPIIFAATLAAKTIFHAASTFYFLGKWSNATNEAKRNEYLRLAIDNTIATFVGVLATAAVASVFIFGKFALAAVGVGAGVLGAAFTLYKGVSLYKEIRKNNKTANFESLNEEEPERTLSSSAKTFRKVGRWMGLGQKSSPKTSIALSDDRERLVSTPANDEVPDVVAAVVRPVPQRRHSMV